MIEVRIVDGPEVHELAPHASAWDELALAAPERLPMLSHAWVASFLEHDRTPSRWRCLFAYEDGRLVGVLPAMRVRERAPGVRFSGPLRADLHTYSAYPLLEASNARTALAAMLTALRAVEPHYLWLRVGGVRKDAAIMSIKELGGVRLSRVEPATWRRSGSILPVRGSFEQYESGLSDNFRRNLRKARNRCARSHEVTFRFLTGPAADSREEFDRFLDLESSGWKGREGTGIKCIPHLADFYWALCKRMSQRGWLEWHFLDFDGAPVAAHLAIRLGRSLVLPKIAYDEAHARLGPGSLLFHETIARAFADDGPQEINCLSDTPWHRNWRMSTAQYTDLVITPDRPVPRLASRVELHGAALARRALSSARRAGMERADGWGLRAPSR